MDIFVGGVVLSLVKPRCRSPFECRVGSLTVPGHMLMKLALGKEAASLSPEVGMSMAVQDPKGI